jgi:AAA15 family ATPase/GTPase
MLVNFKFSNFKSFKDEAEFSMEPLTNNGSISNAIETGYKKAPCVYRTSAIFGANASGKSNFIEAMLALKFLITKSYRNSTDSNIYGLEYKLADTQNNALFEIEFIKNRNVYRYFIELNKKAIVREEAYYNELQADKREKCLFKRTLTEFNSPCGIDKNIAEQTIKTRLLVSELINNRNTQNKFIHDIYQWFSNDIHIYVNEQFELTTNIYSTESDDLGEKTKFLNKAGINISKLLYVGQSLKSIHTNEVGKDIIFDFEAEESAGTKTLLDLSKDLIEVLKGGRILFADELDKSLHPHLVKYLVSLFNNPETNPKGAQLIFTSHAHYLMDGEHLTRDQIWFVSKENGYSSDLYSLSDFKQIKRKKGAFYNEYMYGIFGAIPNINGD